MLAASLRIDGKRSPAPSTRPATLARMALITSRVRAPPRPLVVAVWSKCMGFHIDTVSPDCMELSLVSPLPKGQGRDWGKRGDMQAAGNGWGNGLLGVVIFSGSLPATRVAVGGFSATFLTSARAVIAALLGAALLALLHQQRPARKDLASLAIVSMGVVIGFPLLTALALKHITSAHSIVFVGLLPLATAIFAVLRGGERPRPCSGCSRSSAARRLPALRCRAAARARSPAIC